MLTKPGEKERDNLWSEQDQEEKKKLQNDPRDIIEETGLVLQKPKEPRYTENLRCMKKEASALFMILLFIINYNNLLGVISILWLPLYLFSVLFLFSLTNLYFSGRD